MEFDGFPAIWPDGHQWAMAPLPIYAAAYIHSRLCIEPPIWCAALRIAAQRCAMVRNGAQRCATLAQCCAALHSTAQRCEPLRKCCAPYKYTYEVYLSILKYTYKYT